MNSIVARINWIMLVSGALTCTMIYAAVRRDPLLPNICMQPASKGGTAKD